MIASMEGGGVQLQGDHHDRRQKPRRRTRKVLGLGWNSESDTIFVETKVNVSKKRKGIKELPDIEVEELVEKLPEDITIRYQRYSSATEFSTRILLPGWPSLAE